MTEVAMGTRHSKSEIASNLIKAKEMAATGETQKDIALVLGVSVMTLHRWRKIQDEQSALVQGRLPPEISDAPRIFHEPSEKQLDEMLVENARLRRLVTNLMLEKLKLEEEIERRRATRSVK